MKWTKAEGIVVFKWVKLLKSTQDLQLCRRFNEQGTSQAEKHNLNTEQFK